MPARKARPAISEELAKSLLKSGAAHVEVEPRSYAYAEIALQIRRLIEQGRLRPGDRLPPERDVAAVLGVSRTSVRDAIRVLEMRGLVLIPIISSRFCPIMFLAWEVSPSMLLS